MICSPAPRRRRSDRMALTTITNANGRELPRLTACPFCGMELTSSKVPSHISTCEEAPR
jgi:transcription elongation factor Elf1